MTPRDLSGNRTSRGDEDTSPDAVGTDDRRAGRFLLSGPIGSGKSTVGSILADLGATVIEADRVGHEVLQPDGEAFHAVRGRWPEVVVDGRIDRVRLARIVFADDTELRTLESFTHPAIASRIGTRVSRAEEHGTGPVVVELPLLDDILGDTWHRVVVTADDAVRRQRAIARGMAADDVDRRMASQPPLSDWIAAADSTIGNDGDLEALRRAVVSWWEQHLTGP